MRDQLLHTNAEAEPDRVRVMTFNTWLMPVKHGCDFADRTVTTRAERVGRYLEENASDADILLLQEAWLPQGTLHIAGIINSLCCCSKIFGRRRLEETGLTGYYVSKRNSISFLSSCGLFLDSGLLIASRWPIKRQAFCRFDDATGEDKLAAKGVLVVETGNMIIVNTHLNAQKSGFKARSKQIDQLKRFISEILEDWGAKQCKLIIGGDWNICGLCMNDQSKEEYQNLSDVMNSLGLKDAVAVKKYNQATFTTEHCREIGATNLESLIPQRLDMLFSNAEAENVEAIWADCNVPTLFDAKNPRMVSDHAPLFATFDFTRNDELR